MPEEVRERSGVLPARLHECRLIIEHVGFPVLTEKDLEDRNALSFPADLSFYPDLDRPCLFRSGSNFLQKSFRIDYLLHCAVFLLWESSLQIYPVFQRILIVGPVSPL